MKPRILFFLDTIVTGGAERQTVLLAKALMRQGYECNLLGYYAAHSSIVVDEEIRPYVRFVGGRSMHHVWEWPRAWSIIAGLKPDVIINVNLSAMPIAVAGRALGAFRSKICAVFHTTMFKDAKMRRNFPIVRIAARFIDCLIYVCNAQRDYWAEHGLGARDIEVIHNGVNVGKFSPDQVAGSRDDAKAQLGFAPTDYVIGLTAVFRPEKNLVQAVDALARLRDAGMQAKLLFVGGDGEARIEVVRHVETLGLVPHVVFAVNPADVRPFQKAMDVGLLCSTRGETFSQAALEMMAMEVPMIMPRISGCVEMLDGGRGGRIFEIGDTDGLVSHLLELHNQDARAQAALEARDVVASCFAEDVMVEKYRLLAERLVVGR